MIFPRPRILPPDPRDQEWRNYRDRVNGSAPVKVPLLARLFSDKRSGI